MLYLYAIVDDPGAGLPASRGVGDEPLKALAVGGLLGGLGAVVGAIGDGPPAAGAASVRRHLDVLEALMKRCAVLPVRFGSTYSGEEELEAHILDAQEELAADLARVRGHLEIGVRVADPRAPVPALERDGGSAAGGGCGGPPGPGARYLEARRAVAGRRVRMKWALEALAGNVAGRLAPLASFHKWKAAPLPEGRPGVSLAFLVKQEKFDAFREALAELRRVEPDLEFLCTGPWPPYSFVSGV
jgi:hypothetical protein